MAVRHDRKVSILDVMGPVMVGPSSSHTAGTARLGRVAREILNEDPVDVHFFLHPPLAATYRGHGGRSERPRSEEHTSELQSQSNLVCRLLLEKKKKQKKEKT